MKPFKVICKAADNSWFRDNGLKTTVVRRFFGLIKRTTVGRDLEKSFGPSKEEICIVIDVKEDGYYKLAGYTQYGWYCPEPFVRLDEFTESQKEIAEKSQPVMN